MLVVGVALPWYPEHHCHPRLQKADQSRSQDGGQVENHSPVQSPYLLIIQAYSYIIYQNTAGPQVFVVIFMNVQS